ncbi:hypothetical protein MZG98_27520, partial [Escherichia coli]|nr:hypothetical protein [Escherichia coli]
SSSGVAAGSMGVSVMAAPLAVDEINHLRWTMFPVLAPRGLTFGPSAARSAAHERSAKDTPEVDG